MAALDYARELRPHVVVMDISMPVMNGIDATRAIVRELPETSVLALSMESDRRFVIEVLRAGAKGYVLKDCTFEELVTGVRTVAADDTYLGPRISRLIVKDYLQRIPDDAAATHETLSVREREILQKIADGMNAKEIAFAFDVSVKTVENQRQSIMKKLNLYSIAKLTKYAIREGLTPLR